MAKFQIPGDAFKSFAEGEKLIDPGWHPFEITKVETRPSNAGDSLNHRVYVRCLEDQWKARSERAQLHQLFNEKSFAPDKAGYEVIPFLLALDDSLKATDLISTGITIDGDNLIGKQLKMKVFHEEYNGRMREKFNAFASINAAV